MVKRRRRAGSRVALAAFAATLPALALAQTAFKVDVPAQDLGDALRSIGRQTNTNVIFEPALVKGLSTSGVHAELTVEEAIRQLLLGTRLAARRTSVDTIVVPRQPEAPPPNNDGSTDASKDAGTNTSSVAPASQSSQPASELSSNTEGVLTEIIVTAQRRGQSVLEVPMSISVLGNEQIERAGMASLEAVAHSTPSLTVLETGTGASTYTMRGVGNITGTSALVGIYFDEIGVAKGGIAGQLNLPLFDLNRIEVLKGPQGTLYGEGSVGGTIRLISNDPHFNGVDGMIDVAQSFTDEGESSQTVRGVVNLPVLDDVLGFRIATVYENLGGWIDIPAEARKDVNDVEMINVRVKGLWQPTDKLKIASTIVVSERDNDSTPTGTDENYRIATVFPNQDLSGDDGYKIFNITATYDFDAFDLLSTSSYIEDDRTARYNQFLRFAAFPPSFPLAGLITENNPESETFTQEIRLNSNGNGPFTWDVGAYYRDLTQHMDDLSTLTFGGVVSSVTPIRSETSSRSSAVFTNVSYALTDRIELGAGLRYFYDDVEIVRDPGTAQQTVDQESFDALTPRVYASYDLGAGSMVYLNVAKGFRSGGFNTLGVPAYQPEDLVSYDIGIKSELFDRAVVAELAVFYSEYTKAQTIATLLNPDNTLSSRIANVGEAEIKGAELAVSWRVTDALSLGINGGVTDTEVTSLQGANASSHV
ncbi:MAG TPA: TonB-dependent receptor, partial [Polyangiaceae bacterium]|nr:TonB-dependent receptor [Polyangiaceae bacterium]